MTLIRVAWLCLSINLFLIEASHVQLGPIRLFPRRMGVQNIQLPTVDNCPGQICGVLFGKVPGVLLAGADPCAAQDLADEIIDTAKTNPEIKGNTKNQMIEAAKVLAGAEHNSHPDYKNKGEPRNFMYCLKAPKNTEIANIIPKQDPANPPDKFADPKTQKTVLLGEDPRTRPRTGNNTSSTSEKSSETPKSSKASEKGGEENEKQEEQKKKETETNKKEEETKKQEENNKKEEENNKKEEENKTKEKKSGQDKAEGSGGGGSAGFQGIFIDPKTLGKCSNPKIIFQAGFNGRQKKDLTFHPEDQKNYPQSEALNLSIVTRAMCDKMLNCGFKNEDETIIKCRKLGPLIGSSLKDGSGADKWNSAFGITTNFKDGPKT